jgi:glycosyltransferase involved in cell wall biosynthesis
MDVSDTELLSLYRSSELMMLPLTDTTANLAVLEGLSCGLPLVVTDIGGIRDYVDSDCAALVATQDAETMAEQVLRVLNDRARRKAMAQAARAKALTFDWHVIADQMTKVYESVANLPSRMR